MGHWLAYAKARQELEIADAIREKGAGAWVARKVELYRAPTQRRWQPRTEPFLPNYILVTCSDETWHALRDVKGLAGTMMPVSAAVYRRDFAPFMARVDGDYSARMARIEAGERVEAYEVDTVLELIGGPFAGMMGKFRRLVEAEQFYKVRLELALFGGTRELDIDPLHVRKTA